MAARCWDLLVRHLENSRHAQIAVASPLLSLLLLFIWWRSGTTGCVSVSPVCAAGFEGCSMVPSIYPLETLHNSLSLKQVDEFLNNVCESSSEAHAKTMKGRPADESAPYVNKKHWAAIKATRTFLPSPNIILHYHQEHHSYLDDLSVILQNRSFWFCTVLIPVFKKVRDALSPKISSIYVDSISVSKSHLMALSNWAGVDHTPD